MPEEASQIDSAKVRRPFPWLLATLLINILSYLIYGLFICGCHFHAEAVPFSLLPVAWGFFMGFACRGTDRKLLRRAGIVSALLWMLFSWDSNIQFFFH